MPTEIVKEFNKIQCTFMWNGAASSQLGKETLQMDLQMGGKRMFNLQIRNDSIDLIQLKTLLCS